MNIDKYSFLKQDITTLPLRTNGAYRTGLTRKAVVVAACLVLAPASAQQDHPHRQDVRIVFEGALTLPASKFVHEGLKAQDPDAFVVIDSASHCALVRTAIHVDRQQLEAAVAPAGLHIIHLGLLQEPAPQQRSTSAQRPRYLDTGDPVADNIRYDLLKRAWIADHPDQYQRANQAQSDR